MKTLKVLILALFAFFCLSMSTTYSKIWRVNNRSGIVADFTTAQAAHDGASAGDSIFLEPSPTGYGNITLTKKLIIIGTGYFLDQNPETQWKINWPAKLGTVQFSSTPSSTSAYSQLMGVTCNGALTVNVPNITIRRIYLNGSTYLSYVTDTISNINFKENYCIGSLHIEPQTHDIVIQNNIFVLNLPSYFLQISGSVAYNGLFMNNILMLGNYPANTLDIDNFIIQNNIMSEGYFYPSNSIYSFNISNGTVFGNQNGNQQNVNMNTVFLFTGSTDGQYQLKEGSPAIGAGAGGVDCGAFGGPNPYLLSGMPPIPAIYYFMIGDPDSEYNVHLKVKSHN
ncbi:MAG: hypothetical protein NTX61_06295 [Bacteroidetes bacterium]|nr:hypothetical protein [Bacteroidota bacterium]